MAAMDAGYGLEIDVQLSRDNIAMVFHDYDLLKLTGQAGLVRDFTRRTDGNWADRRGR